MKICNLFILMGVLCIMSDFAFAEERVCSFGDKAQAFVCFPDKIEDGKLYPAIINYYGRGGNALAGQINFKSNEFSEFRKLCAQRGYIVVNPEYGANDWYGPHGQAVSEEVLAHLSEVLPVDMSRLFVMGESMGGGAAMTLASHHPKTFRAACDIFGVVDMLANMKRNLGYVDGIVASYGGTPEEVPEIYQDRVVRNHAEALKDLPLMVIHGTADTIIPLEWSEELVKAIRKAGGHPIFLKVPNIGHDNAIIKGYEKVILDFFETANSI